MISILGDLVFVKVLDTFSNPNFLLGIIDQLVEKVAAGSQKKVVVDSERNNLTGLWGIVRNFSTTAYSMAGSLLSSVQEYKRSDSELTEPIEKLAAEESVLNSPVFRFIDTVTQFSSRKPILTGILMFFRSYILRHTYISAKVDRILKDFLWSKTTIEDDSLAPVIGKLRNNLFGEKKNSDDNQKNESISVPELAAKASAVISQAVPQSALMPTLTYLQEDQETSVRNVLEVFTKSQHVNKLLIVQLLDLIMARAFPELSEELD